MTIDDEALIFATIAHHGQMRDGGVQPYILHPIRVAANFSSPEIRAVAFLHDVLEDTDTDWSTLCIIFPEEVTTPLAFLTRHFNGLESYEEYILRISKNDIAVQVKLADLADNMFDLPETDTRYLRYSRAMTILKDVANAKKL